MCRLDGDWASSYELHNDLISCSCSKKQSGKRGPTYADNPIYHFNIADFYLSDVSHKYNP